MLLVMVNAEILARKDPDNLNDLDRVSSQYAIFAITGSRLQASLDKKFDQNPNYKPTKGGLAQVKKHIYSRLEEYATYFLKGRSKTPDASKEFLEIVKNAASEAINQYLAGEGRKK